MSTTGQFHYTVIRQIVSRIDRLQDRQTVGQTDNKIDRQADRQTEGQHIQQYITLLIKYKILIYLFIRIFF